MALKIFFGVMVLWQMLLSLLAGDLNKHSYLVYLWNTLVAEGGRGANRPSEPREVFGLRRSMSAWPHSEHRIS